MVKSSNSLTQKNALGQPESTEILAKCVPNLYEKITVLLSIKIRIFVLIS